MNKIKYIFVTLLIFFIVFNVQALDEETKTDTKEDINTEIKEETKVDEVKEEQTEIKKTVIKNNGFINKNGISYKSEPNELGKDVLKTLDIGDVVNVIDSTVVISENDLCEQGYYNVSFYWSNNHKNYEGYVCADNITFEVDTSKYASEFSEAGFPESYYEKLTLLKDAHPNWVFKAFDTKLDFNEVVKNESTIGLNFIQSTDPKYLSLEEGSYDPINKKYIEMEKGGWYQVNSDTVAYYLDPRNFLDQVQIFMFENLGYNSKYQTEEVVETILKNTELLKYSKHFIEAASFNGNSVSPIMLAARSRQEVISSEKDSETNLLKLSNSANGFKYNDQAVYNFYNIGAYNSCKLDDGTTGYTVMCGLKYAYNNAWFDAETSIKEGASIIARSYINVGQNTLYFQKFNVTGNSSGNYSHQYMANIMAPVSEAKTTYLSDNTGDGLLDSQIEFIIPVYNNMTEKKQEKPVEVNEEKKVEIEEKAVVYKAINEVVNNAGYAYNKDYISGINLNTKAFNIIANLIKDDPNVKVTIKNNDNKEIIGEEVIATNNIITIKSGDIEETLRIVVRGDVNGDGKVSSVDYVKVKNYIMNSNGLDGAYKLAADVNFDNKITAVDYVNIKNYIMGGNTVIK